VRAVIQPSATCSARQNMVFLETSSRFLQSISYEDTRFHPYKIHITQELKEQHKTSCVNFSRQLLDIVDNDEGVLDVLIM
jgi:16S rRNA C1402 (ribose-2'-O) methylase RsmI